MTADPWTTFQTFIWTIFVIDMVKVVANTFIRRYHRHVAERWEKEHA